MGLKRILYCRDCKFRKRYWYDFMVVYCLAPRLHIERDLVTGKKRKVFCSEARAFDGFCGIAGRFFQGKRQPPWKFGPTTSQPAISCE